MWKLLYDPARFPEWWAGVGSVEPGQAGEYTMYPEGYPDFPMAQQLRVTESGVTISCLVSDLVFEWRLAVLDDGAATSITVHVEIPEAEAHRLAAQQDVISQVPVPARRARGGGKPVSRERRAGRRCNPWSWRCRGSLKLRRVAGRAERAEPTLAEPMRAVPMRAVPVPGSARCGQEVEPHLCSWRRRSTAGTVRWSRA